MVRKGVKLVLAVLMLLLVQGCLYVDVQVPLDTNFEQTQLGPKTGTASAYSILWLVAWGDAGTQAAANNGGIKMINHADTRTFIFLGPVFTRVTTVVYGD